LYAADADDTLPMVTEGHPGAGQVGGYTFNLEFGQKGAGQFDPARGSLFPYVKSTGIFLSTLDPTANKSHQSFAMNGCLTEFPPNPGLMRTRPLTTVEKPAEQFLYGEESTGTEGTNDGFFHPLVDAFATWHAGKTALVFVDGHAKTIVTEGRYPEVVDASTTPCWPYEPLIGQ
jgi:prepilin-type processing-associated H-X9-DG protein